MDAHADRTPARAREYIKRALDVAEVSGNRLFAGFVWPRLMVLEMTGGDPVDRLASSLPLILRWRDSSEVFYVMQGLAAISLLFSRIGRLNQAPALFGLLMDDSTFSGGQSEFDQVVLKSRATLGDVAFDLRKALDYAESQARLVLADHAADNHG